MALTIPDPEDFDIHAIHLARILELDNTRMVIRHLQTCLENSYGEVTIRVDKGKITWIGLDYKVKVDK